MTTHKAALAPWDEMTKYSAMQSWCKVLDTKPFTIRPIADLTFYSLIFHDTLPKYQYLSLYVPHCNRNLPFDQEQDLSVHLCSSQDFLCHQPPSKPTGFTGLWNIHLVALVLPCTWRSHHSHFILYSGCYIQFIAERYTHCRDHYAHYRMMGNFRGRKLSRVGGK